MQPNPKPPLPQRKHPLHLPPVERHNEPVLIFVTIGLQPRVPALANAAFQNAFVRAGADADAWSVVRYVIMPDHVHLFCRPAREPRVGIRRWSGYLKERVTKRWKAGLAEGNGSAQPRPPGGNAGGDWHGQLEGETAASRDTWRWQPDCWDTQLRSAAHYREKWEYVRLNPVRKGLVARPEDWPWQGELNVLRW